VLGVLRVLVLGVLALGVLVLGVPVRSVLVRSVRVPEPRARRLAPAPTPAPLAPQHPSTRAPFSRSAMVTA